MSANRNSFDAQWLDAQSPNTYAGFEHRPVGERADARAAVLPALAAAVVDHHVHRERVSALLARLGFEKTQAKLDQLLDLASDTARMGNFGEVVASEHLVQRYGYGMPVFKLRHRDSGQPMRGEDIVAFRKDAAGNIDLVAIGESKALQAFRQGKVIDALARLGSSYNPHPQTLDMIVEILYGAGRDEDAVAVEDVIERIVAGTISREHWIVLITGDKPTDPFECIVGAVPSSPPLICVNLSLEGLKSVVDAVFVPSGFSQVHDAA